MMSKLPYKLLAVQLGLGLLDRDHLVDLDRALQPQFGHSIGSQVGPDQHPIPSLGTK